MAWPVRPEFFSLDQLWKNWSIFLKNLGKMDIILMLSKFSDQIGYVLSSIQQFDRSDWLGRVNSKRP
jgi:hypothetical protein